jgi:hypothetical protein
MDDGKSPCGRQIVSAVCRNLRGTVAGRRSDGI